MSRVVIAAGGTAGHIVPALAVADALRAEGAEVLFVGAAGRAEADLVPKAGYEIRVLNLRGLDRRNPLRALGAVGLAIRAIPRARRLLKQWGAQVVIGGGGYVAAPVGLAAASLRTPLVLTEADSHLGISNRMLAPFAKRIFLAFPIEGRKGDKYLVTGRPVPAAVTRASRNEARGRLGFEAGDRVVLVFGGSQGARTINLAAMDAFGGDSGDLAILHVSGHRDYDELKETLERLGAPARYRLIDYMDDFSPALKAADLVVARAGGSMFELAAAGLPAVLVPYPYATADHQRHNARWMAEAGAAVVIEDRDLTPTRLREEVSRLMGDSDVLKKMAAASLSLARPDAAKRIAAATIELAGRPEIGREC